VTPAVEVWRAAGGDIGVYYVVRHDKVVIAALDLRTGKELWARPGARDQPYNLRPVLTPAGDVAVVLGKGDTSTPRGSIRAPARCVEAARPRSGPRRTGGAPLPGTDLCINTDGQT